MYANEGIYSDIMFYKVLISIKVNIRFWKQYKLAYSITHCIKTVNGCIDSVTF